MRTPRLSNQEAHLLQPPAPGRFGAAELEGLAEPVQRHLAQAIAPGTPLATSARLRMRGHIKVGRCRRPGDGPLPGEETPLDVSCRLDGDGRIRSLAFDRWGDADNNGRFGWHRFGGEFTGYRSLQGLTIPSQGRLGWFYGSDRWPGWRVLPVPDHRPPASHQPGLPAWPVIACVPLAQPAVMVVDARLDRR